MGRADHAEKGIGLVSTVYGPSRIKNLVSTVLGIDLCEHHQFGVCWVSPNTPVLTDEVIDLFFSQRKTHGYIGIG